ncbi:MULTISPECIES: DUF805 domain-containing protein [unclassified Anaerobiospirillum]|uniref:DUF805 domain-containing protein n=1 Tax=unclassified Anaerobiospirillum TaxID=2647410 RepID=UPI001FF247F6|nr:MULTISPECIES: DUF805 domain-containing protein [unclassified Anaerobiospirillum]MCK0534316.1 DUF805 domain-containing protein [Anaerobiospirillum sp. NML120511]MCK0539585.1 DUF805 domain-containing protein [Anaerobiospirillum sp. NML02-A-032]
MLTIKQSVQICFVRKAFNTRDRACRSEFWWFYLFVQICSIPLGLLSWLLPGFGSLIYAVFTVVCLYFITATGVRRAHDSGKNGYHVIIPMAVVFLSALTGTVADTAPDGMDPAYQLTLAVLIVCSVGYMLIIMALPGTKGSNRYGPDPLTASEHILNERLKAKAAGSTSAPSKRHTGPDADFSRNRNDRHDRHDSYHGSHGIQGSGQISAGANNKASEGSTSPWKESGGSWTGTHMPESKSDNHSHKPGV